MFAGYALARLKFRGSEFLGTAIFITYLVPQTLLFIPLADIIRDMQLGNTPWALMLTYPTFLIPFCTWLLMGYFKTIPKELEECARIDGATRFGAMVRIIFPVAIPGILSAGIFAFTLSWNEFIYALVFMASADQKTVPGRRGLGADPRRHLLLGPADGGRAARLGAGRARLFLLRRVLRHRPHRLGEGLTMAIVTIRDLNKKYENGFHAVKDVNLEIRDKEFVVLVGPSGCGKTTTLRMVAGLEEITSGEIRIGEQVVNDLPPMDRNIAMVFQNYALYPHKTVFDNMAFGLQMRELRQGRRSTSGCARRPDILGIEIAARAQAAPALRRPAPARRRRARDRAPPAGVPVRRAALEPGRASCACRCAWS